ncbi:TPA: type II toxin-antitoxin system RelE/ParE family toxin [Candidatus Micrarchaeota archaeon]|nr:type II toxin-antitoxin system RelE/ParE family toxin [Candidatus Micrarchaeota archaeon]
MFSVDLSNQALKALKKADAKMRQKAHELINTLHNEPVPVNHYDVIKISGTDGHYRIRLSSHRLKYFVDWNEKKIQILDFERRNEHTYG